MNDGTGTVKKRSRWGAPSCRLVRKAVAVVPDKAAKARSSTGRQGGIKPPTVSFAPDALSQ
jgi:hypothetical protein